METRELIADVFLRAGREKGADRLSLGDIANAVGIKKASIYAHFSCYDKIRTYVIEREMKKISEQEPVINFRAKNPWNLIYDFCASQMETFSVGLTSDFMIVCNQLRYTDTRFATAAENIEKMTEARVRVVMEFCVQKGWFNMPDTDAASAFFTSRLLPIMLNGKDDELERLIDDSVELFTSCPGKEFPQEQKHSS